MASDQSFIDGIQATLERLQRNNKKLLAKNNELKKLNKILQDNCRAMLKDNIALCEAFVVKNKLVRDTRRRTHREGYRTCYRCRKQHMMYFMAKVIVDNNTRWFCGDCYEI